MKRRTPTSASSRRAGRKAPVIALLSAAAVSFAFQVGLLALVDALPGAGYLAFGAVVTAAAALAVGAASSAVRAPATLALAAWAALEAAFFFLPPRHLALAAAFGVVTAILVAPARTDRTPAALGVVVGSALCLVLIIFPKVLILAAPGLPPGWKRDAARVATYALLLAIVPVAGVLRRTWRRTPSPAAILIAALVAAAAITPFTWEHRPWIMGPEGASRRAAGAVREADHASILLVVLDTVRADHLSVYGYERDTSPELARFVARHERARVYPLAFSTAPWTVPAHASLLTGLLPSSHAAHDGNVVDARRTMILPGLRADRTLAETLKAGGWATAGIFANSRLAISRGLERGFDVWLQPRRPRPLFLLAETARARLLPFLLPEPAKPYPCASAIREEVLRFVDAAGETPWFVLANFMEAHQPYAARTPFGGRFGGDRGWNPPVVALAGDSPERKLRARDRYDEEIASLDAELGRLLAELERRGALDRSWIVITSDHGEAFGEHGTVNHGSSVYNEQVHVPLIVVPPSGVELPRRDGAVSLLDVAATLSALAGDEEKLGAGVDLRVPPRDDDGPARIEFFGNPGETGQAALRRWGPLFNTPSRAVVWRDTKLVEHSGRAELYDLASDPQESVDLRPQREREAAALALLLPPLAGPEAPSSHAPTEGERDALRALGYLDE
jgi:arylsulfatase A-like enzyme